MLRDQRGPFRRPLQSPLVLADVRGFSRRKLLSYREQSDGSGPVQFLDRLAAATGISGIYPIGIGEHIVFLDSVHVHAGLAPNSSHVVSDYRQPLNQPTMVETIAVSIRPSATVSTRRSILPLDLHNTLLVPYLGKRSPICSDSNLLAFMLRILLEDPQGSDFCYKVREEFSGWTT